MTVAPTAYRQDVYFVYRIDPDGIKYVAKDLSKAGVADDLLRWLYLLKDKKLATEEDYKLLMWKFIKQL